MHFDPQIDRPLKSGPEIREFFFPGRPNKAEAPNQTNVDPERARQLAVTMLRKKAREFMTLEGTTLGLPRLRPGNHVEIRGFRPPFDGFYYVTKTVHSCGADGFRTRFSARRPGMPEPPYGEG
jgi:phage protein D